MGMVLGVIGFGIMFNKLFLEDFYIYKNKNNFIQSSSQITRIYQNDKKNSKEIMEQASRIDGMNFIIAGDALDIKFSLPQQKVNQGSKRIPKEIEEFIVEHKSEWEENYAYGIIRKEDKQSTKIIMVSKLQENELLILTKSMKGIEESVAIANQFYFIAGIIIIGIGAGIIIMFSQRITKPIIVMSRVAREIAQLNFNQHITVKSQDEIGKLGESINELSNKLSKSMTDLQQDVEDKKQLVRNMSHELKTPIAVIKGYTEGLKYGVVDDQEKKEKYCNVIVQECDQMDYIVRQLLQLSIMSENNFQLHKKYVNIGKVIEMAIERFEPQMKKENIECIYKIKEIPHILGDIQLIEQVLNNFITNAINHIEGEKKIEISVWDTEASIGLGVFNTGKPVPEKELEHLWDVFYKVDKARTRKYGGHGIGLSIVKQIAELHQGRVGVVNQKEGILFYIELPLFHKDFSNQL